ncbi:hypothetical protein PoB_003338500 [Plakobranchus ocellatus]|uniref:Uncharacterized protein n=1 Tax=Plakobranchus ocellatus TaxID=259542 RepID=A0AAV4AFC8_9GAST|nr:hypothetical protein PoB_003338500 [Plakobranchus ocellatus]
MAELLKWIGFHDIASAWKSIISAENIGQFNICSRSDNVTRQTSKTSGLVAFLEGSKHQNSKAKVEVIKSESFNLLQETQGEETSKLSDEWFNVQPTNTTEL